MNHMDAVTFGVWVVYSCEIITRSNTYKQPVLEQIQSIAFNEVQLMFMPERKEYLLE